MKYLSMPADFKKDTIREYSLLNSSSTKTKVFETYGQMTMGEIQKSGRDVSTLPSITKDDLYSYIKYSTEMNIQFNYTMNAQHMNSKEYSSQEIRKIKNTLFELHEIGVRNLTISLPTLIEIVKSTNLNFNIKASVICQITNPNKALLFKEYGVNKIVVDESITRNFDALRKICDAFDGDVEIIVNSGCHLDCIYKVFHYNMLAESEFIKNDVATNYYINKCTSKNYSDISNIIKMAWIRPEDIKYYDSVGIKHFKIQGRQSVLNGDPVKIAKCYIYECYDGNLYDLIKMFPLSGDIGVYVDNKKLDGFINKFYENSKFCSNNCSKCQYCKDYALKAVDYEGDKRNIDMLNRLLKKDEIFEKLVNSI